MTEQVKMGEIFISAEMTHVEAQAQGVKAYAEREAIVMGDDRLTFRQLGERIDALAAGLYKLGLRKGDVVVLLLPTCLEFVYLYWAVGKTGAVVAPVEPLSRQREVAHILADSEAKAVVFQPNVSGNDLLSILQNVRDELPNLSHLIVCGDDAPEGMIAFDSLLESDAPQPPEGITGPDDLWALLYTSGTTGRPKGVMHTHRTAMGQMLGGAKMLAAMKEKPLAQVGTMAKLTMKYGTRYARSMGKQGTMLSLSPIHATGGHGVVRMSMFSGDRVVAPVRFHPVRALELIDRERATMMIATPSMYRLMLEVQDFDRYDKSSLLIASSSMAYMPPKLGKQVRERFNCPLIIAYGSTEAGGVTATSLGDGVKLSTETIGGVTGGVEARVVDNEHRTLPPGQVGEIAVKGEGIMAGYYKAPELTADVLDEEGWYYTGDLGTMDKNGVYRIVGRKKDMIIRGGQNIFPPEIENLINTHPAVLTSAAVGVPAEAGSENVWAFVVPKDGQTPTAGEILKLCRRNLTAFKVPSEVRFIDELPMAARLKVQKYKLRAMAQKELEDAGVVVSADTMLSMGPDA